MREVDSDFISHVDYNEENNRLSIYISNSDKRLEYTYKNVPKQVFEEFINAYSKGKYYNKYIKGEYESIHTSKITNKL
jgi:hypothetical protein